MDSNDTSTVCLLHSWGCPLRNNTKITLSDHWLSNPTQFSATPLSAQGSYGDEYQACSSRVLQLSNSAEILLRVASEREQEAPSKNTLFSPIIEWSEILRWLPLAQAGIDDRAPFFRYGGLHLPFSGITQRGLVSVYERPIIAGVRILIVSSTWSWTLVEPLNLQFHTKVLYKTQSFYCVDTCMYITSVWGVFPHQCIVFRYIVQTGLRNTLWSDLHMENRSCDHLVYFNTFNSYSNHVTPSLHMLWMYGVLPLTAY